MKQPGSLAFSSSPCDSERERIQELSRYYCTFGRPSRSASGGSDGHDGDLHGDKQPSTAVLSTDITLTALAQLGVHRLACERSFVSIIDGENQHIIAEATASVSLRDKDLHLPGDAIYLGAQTLDLAWGVCPHTIQLFTGRCRVEAVETANVTANRTRYIIRDFTQEDCFKDCPYVCDWPHMRFYAEVPLYSSSGYVLGSYCVVDNKPRMEFDDHGVGTLQEIADAIARHLENVRIAHCHRRSECLVQGLTTFVKDYTDFDPREASSARRLESTAKASNSEDPLPSAEDHEKEPLVWPSTKSKDCDFGLATSSSINSTEETPPIFPASTQPSSLDSKSDRQIATPGEEKSLEAVLKYGERDTADAPPRHSSLPPSADSIPISDRVNSIFSRASVLLKESMDLDGVVFLDATQSNPSFLPSHDHGSWEPLPKTATPDVSVTPFPSPLRSSDLSSTESDTACEVISSTVKTPGANDVQLGTEFVVSERLLDMLIVHFPQGQIFNLDSPVENNDYMCYAKETGNFQARLNATKKISRRLSHLLPDARSVLFFPLWDYSKSRWMTGTLVWTRDDHRCFDKEELHYFKVFGNSIVSEVSRIHWTATEKSKFDFISSVSHELRSPLHGILASAELLHTTQLQPLQAEMLRMIETSGLTLLDTTDHLLDFCKINNLTRTRKLRKHAQKHTSTLVSDFNLGTLVEEVAEILFSGQRAPVMAARITNKNLVNSLDHPTCHEEGERSVVVRIDKRSNWDIRSQGGAWRRIVMNLLGNAMKWTRAGFVEISLSQARNASEPTSHLAHLSVTDTGHGIAPDFLRHRLFSPFTQEDPLAEGVGLGLSIVRQLVASLSGHITVRSEVGIGTQVDIHVPVEYVNKPLSRRRSSAAPNDKPDAPTTLQACLVAFNAYPDLKETPTGMLTAEAKRKLSIQSELADVFMTQFGWTISLAESLDKGRGDVAVIEETTLQAAEEGLQSLEHLAVKHDFQFFIILSSKTPIFNHPLPPNFIRVSQPFGPRKIKKAAEKALKILEVQLQPEPMRVSLPLLPVIESVPELEPLSATDDPVLSVAPSSLSEMPRLLPESESADSGNPTVDPQPIPGPTPQGDEISVGPTLEPPAASLPPSLAHSATEPSPKKLPEATSPVSALSDPKVGHVLIVDDNDINLKIMANFMRKIGCTYDLASNGLIALEKYKSSAQPYTYVLMDISMPVMDGLVSTSKIRQYEKEQGLKLSCIMAVTGVASDTMQQQALAAGINNYLIKPLSLLELRKIMGAV